MNKYQKALDDLYNEPFEMMSHEECRDLLQELVDKATPYKPKGKFYTMKECKCKNTVYRHHKYCHECGQELYWSEDGGE